VPTSEPRNGKRRRCIPSASLPLLFVLLLFLCQYVLFRVQGCAGRQNEHFSSAGSVSALSSSRSETDKELDESRLPMIDPSELIGRTFLKPKEPDGTRLRATIVSLALCTVCWTSHL